MLFQEGASCKKLFDFNISISLLSYEQAISGREQSIFWLPLKNLSVSLPLLVNSPFKAKKLHNLGKNRTDDGKYTKN